MGLITTSSTNSSVVSFRLRENKPLSLVLLRYDLLKVGFDGDCLRVDVGIGHHEDEVTKYLFDAPHELKVAAACLCAGLMPPSVFADLLEDHRPDLSEAANFLREWERVHKEQQK